MAPLRWPPIATTDPQQRLTELAGPDRQDLVYMARRNLAARGDSVRLVPSWHTGSFTPEMAGEILLPGPDARIAPTNFETWLPPRRPAPDDRPSTCDGDARPSESREAEK